MVAALGLLALGCSPSAVDGSGAEATAQSEAAEAPPRDPVVVIASADVPAVEPLAAPDPGAGAQRIVSLATGVGETLAALGVADRVVGRDETSDVPAIAAAPVVTRAHSVSAERVLALDPDLVIVDAATSPPEALEQISAAGVRIVEVPEAWTLADMVPRTEAIAAAVGVDATALVDLLPTPAPAQAAGPRVAFLYLRGNSAVYLLGGAGSGADALLAAAGAVDAGAEAGYDAFVPLTAEALVALDPEVLLVMTGGLESVGGVEGLRALPGLAQTTAGRDGRVIAVEDTLLLSFGPRTGALVERLREALERVAP